MSWSFPPNGITQEAGGDGNTTLSLPDSDLQFTCTPPFNFVKYHNDFFSPLGPTPFDLATALAALPDIYDWYTIYLFVEWPKLPVGKVDCDTDNPPWVNVTLQMADGSDVTIVRTLDGVPVSSSGSAPWPPLEFTIPADFGGLAELVQCPDPQFPVPDFFGNEAGRVLWTRAQVEAFVATGAGMEWGGAWGKFDTVLTVGREVQLHSTIAAYSQSDIPEGTPQVIAGPAVSGVVRHSRRVVG